MSRHDKVDVVRIQLVCQGDDFAAAPVGAASQARMSYEDREVGPFGAHCLQHVVYRRLAPAEREPRDVWGRTNLLDGGCHEPDEGHTQSRELNNVIWSCPFGASSGHRVEHIRGEPRILRFTDSLSQRVHRPIQLVIADGGGVETEEVERCDRRRAVEEIRGECPLHLIPRVDPQGGAAAMSLGAVHRSLQDGSAPHEPSLGPGIGPRLECAVEVGHSQDPNVD